VSPPRDTRDTSAPKDARPIVSPKPTEFDATTTEVAPRVRAALGVLEAACNGFIDVDIAVDGTIGLLRAANRWCEIDALERRWAS